MNFNPMIVLMLPMLFEDALDCYEADLVQLIHDMREKSEGCDTDAMLEKLMAWCDRDGVRVLDATTCDYDKFLSDLWYDIPY